MVSQKTKDQIITIFETRISDKQESDTNSLSDRPNRSSPDQDTLPQNDTIWFVMYKLVILWISHHTIHERMNSSLIENSEAVG